MSIRIQEWGMMRVPADMVHVPVQGLMGWDSVARGLGEGVSAMLKSSAELVQGQESVQKTGELARFSQRLREISDEARAELADRDVKDWEYSWRAACEPRLAEAVGELPPAARQAGEVLAKAHSERTLLEARRDSALQALDTARDNWRCQLEDAVQQGDEGLALTWLERGKGVFVAPAQEEGMAGRICSRANLARWERDFASSPLQTLERWRQATPEDLPAGGEERESLGRTARTYTTQGRKALVAQSLGQLRQNEETPAGIWERARRAGLVSDTQYRNATAPRRPLGEVERCRWYRKVDELEEDEGSRLELQMEIATAPMPVKDRAELMQRLETAAGVEHADRVTLSRNLWNLYNAGVFGCPGDAMAGRRMAAMQRQGARLLATQGTDATAAWVQGQARRTNRWVRFSDMHPQPDA